MATDAPITGAPAGARPNVINFPTDPVALLRLQLPRCRNRRMLDAWTADLRKHRTKLAEDAYAGLVAMGAVSAYRLSQEGC
ncbi:MAG TPA: hypothetical protein VF695_00490 [Sphingomonas sp.]|jgi:hypothetical protein